MDGKRSDRKKEGEMFLFDTVTKKEKRDQRCYGEKKSKYQRCIDSIMNNKKKLMKKNMNGGNKMGGVELKYMHCPQIRSGGGSASI